MEYCRKRYDGWHIVGGNITDGILRGDITGGILREET
jgi:hypothetical protein